MHYYLGMFCYERFSKFYNRRHFPIDDVKNHISCIFTYKLQLIAYYIKYKLYFVEFKNMPENFANKRLIANCRDAKTQIIDFFTVFF